MSSVEQFLTLPSNLIFAHLNTRSFKAHYEDIESDYVLTDCDLMMFSETRMEDNVSSFYDKIKDFNIYFHNDHSDSFRSLAVCYRDTLDYQYVDSIPGVLVFTVQKLSFSSKRIKFMLLYKKNCISQTDFAYMLYHILFRYPDIDIIVGDFNEDGFNMPQVLLSQLNSYNQLIKEPTQISGRVLDQIYVNKKLDFDSFWLLKHVHFSDHDATVCKLEV